MSATVSHVALHCMQSSIGLANIVQQAAKAALANILEKSTVTEVTERQAQNLVKLNTDLQKYLTQVAETCHI